MPRRAKNELRRIAITPHFLVHPEGSALVEFGDTRVICTASIEARVPQWMVGKGKGWVTAEYDMLPRATNSRKDRDSKRGRINGRTQEISRLIGRSLRIITDLRALGERMVTIDCDVIQADGGTRTAAITGGFVALALAAKSLQESGKVTKDIIKQNVAAISAGILDGEAVLDLDYSMDSRADVDMNVVMTGDKSLAEIQGTAEGASFERSQLDAMLNLAFEALPTLIDVQTRAIAAPMTSEPQPIRS